MYSREEEKLRLHKKTYDHIHIPHDLIDEHIQAGVKQAKDEQKPKRRMNWLIGVAIVAIILTGFISTKHILDFIRDNKGLIGAIEHDYYQELGKSAVKEDITFTVDGVIADENGMVLFYTIDSDEKRDRMRVKEVQLLDGDGEDLDISSLSYGEPESNKQRQSSSGMVEAFYTTPSLVKDFKIEVEVIGSSPDGTFEGSFADTFTVPFTLPKDVLAQQTYEMNETVSIEGQKITFLEAIVSPLRTAIHVKMNSDNTKQLLNFEDLRLVDGNGETWGKIVNGVTGNVLSDEEQIIYLQSNYFRDPTELYLEINNIQAVDKEDLMVVVDPKKEEIIHQPKGNLLNKVKVKGGYLVFEMDSGEDSEHPEFGFVSVYDEDGASISSMSSFQRQTGDMIEVGVAIDDLSALNGLISLEISHYPTWIKGDEKIKIK